MPRNKMDNKFKEQKHTLEQGAVILLITAVLVKIIGALFKIPLSSSYCLGDLGFGYFSAAYDLINPFTILSISGLPVAVSKLVAENQNDNNSDSSKIFFISRKVFLWFGVVVFFVSLALVFPFTYATDSSGSTIYCFLAIIPSFLFYCVLASYRGYFEGITNMMPPAVSSLIEAFSKLVLGFSFAFITVRLTKNPLFAAATALFGITLGTVFSTLYLHTRFKKLGISYDKSYKYDNKLVKQIVSIALPIALCSFAASVVGLVDAITVRWQLNSLFESDFLYFNKFFSKIISEIPSDTVVDSNILSTVVYGIRSKAYTIYNIVPSLTAFLGVSAIPHISKAYCYGDTTSIIKHISKLLKYTSVICLPAGIGIIALNKNIMILLYGNTASSELGGKMLLLYGVAMFFTGLALVLVNVLQGLGLQKRALLNVAIGVVFKIVLNLFLCDQPVLNIQGSVISTVVCYILIFTLNIISLKKAIGVVPQITNIFLKPLLASIICCSVAFLIVNIKNSAIYICFSLCVAILIYVFLTFVLKVFSKEELAELPLIDKLFNH